MGWWKINADTLAGSRFVISPLAEATAALFTLHRGSAAHPGERRWLEVHLPRYRARLSGDPITALLLEAARRPGWNADFITPTPLDDQEFGEELARIRQTSPERVRADLEVALGGPVPARLKRTDLAERAADLIEWVWTEAVEPDWERRRRIFEGDILARTGRLGQDGLATALEQLRPGSTRWLGDGRLQINTHDYPPREISGAQLIFVPVTAAHGWVSWEEPHRYALIYPCSGVLVSRTAPPQALGRLLGTARAGVLVLLETPKSTTQLVALTGQGLGSVGRHLKVLLDAGLVERRRAGRSMLYYRTALGDALVEG